VHIEHIIWLQEIVEKLVSKHGVTPEEVEEVFLQRPVFHRGPKGQRLGEDLYYGLGQTEEGRYLFVVFILKADNQALVLSARDMDHKERRAFRRR